MTQQLPSRPANRRVLCCGSRGWTDYPAILNTLRRWTVYEEDDPANRGGVLIHGGATGADMLAEKAARELGWTVCCVPADWKRHGRKAGPIRNRQMLDMDPGVVLAFWDGTSRGTQDTIREAARRGIRVEIVPDRGGHSEDTRCS